LILELEKALELELSERKQLIERWNRAYRAGAAFVEDEVYDAVLESLPEEDPLLEKVGFEVASDSRKATLPIPMFSMDKVKTMEEIHRWMTSKGLLSEEKIIVTPKYDGLSFLVQASTRKAFTRGNGVEGQQSEGHFKKLLGDRSWCPDPDLGERHVIGEVIMSRQNFINNYASDYRNPRNLVAGLFNQKDPGEALQDVDFIVYGVGEEKESKSRLLELISSLNTKDLPFWTTTLGELTQEILEEKYLLWNESHEIDGLIIEVDDRARRLEVGREKNNNPGYARAWKGFSASSASTVIQKIRFQVSKDGRLAPVASVDPVELDGVTVSNVTLNNASMMEANGWGEGAKVKIIRSGMVIPKIIGTIDLVKPILPVTCPSCDSTLVWDDNHVHLKCAKPEECSESRIQRILSFFKIMEIEEVGGKLVEQLHDQGYDSVKKILSMDVNDFESLDRFAQRKAEVVYESIHSKLQNVALEKVQHASGLFQVLGTKRLALVSHYREPSAPPSKEELETIDGYSDVTAEAYLKAIGAFWSFLDGLPVTLSKPEAMVSSEGPASGMKVCFTGYRHKEAESVLQKNGAKIVSGVTGKTTHLVCKDPAGMSSKLKKARDLGCVLWGPPELEEFLISLG